MIKLPTFETFLKEFKSILYRRKERIIVPGEEINSVYYIVQGYVMQTILSPNGNEFTPYIFAPNTFFPLIWWETEKLSNKHDYEYESLTPVEVYRIPKDKLISFLKKNPHTAFVLNEKLTDYSRGLLKKLETRIFSDAFHMVILALLDLEKLFGSPCARLDSAKRAKKQNKKALINYWFTHQDIANISGLSREVVTKQMNKLIEKKLVSYENHFILINNIDSLKTTLESEE